LSDPTSTFIDLAPFELAQAADAKPPAPKASGSSGPLELLFDLGGPIVVILVILSVVALTIVLVKLYQFYRGRLLRHGFVRRALQDWATGKPDKALDVLAKARNPIARVLQTAMSNMLYSGGSEAIAREEAGRVAADELKALSSYLRGLELIAALAPLIGLLGTVVGMIIAFQDLQATGSRADPGILAGGIWQALLTTAVGLSIAVVVSGVLSVLESAVDRTHHRMEDALTRVFTSPPHSSSNPSSPNLQPGGQTAEPTFEGIRS
jgi:biopolymer transport protein ExbB